MNQLMRMCSVAVLMTAGIGMTAPHASALPPESGISYQGQLFQDGMPVDGFRDFRFRLYDDAVAGNLIGSIELLNTEVSEGLFGVELDFGVGPWESNEQLWLAVEAGPADGMQNYEIISRMKLGAVPYALNTRGFNVNSSGRVGIGTTNQQDILHIAGGNARILTEATSGFFSGIRSRLNGQEFFTGVDSSFDVQPGWHVYDNTQGVRRLALLANGNFGIGTSLPSSTLHIMNGGATSLPAWPNADLILEGNTGDVSLAFIGPKTQEKVIMFGNDDNFDDGAIIYDKFGQPKRGMSFRTAQVERMQITAEGNVGIGTTAPASRLDVRYSNGNGIEVTDTNTASSAIGVQSTVGAGTGIRGESINGSGSTFGVYGQVASPSGWGVYSNGRLGASGTKSFMIDHPLDPAGSYLLHYSSESPVPQNRYNGNVYLDRNGRGVVTLPDYFASINTDHRYTLTPIGAPAPNLYIETEIQGNTFVIAGGVSGQKISWEVVSQRNDAFVQQRGAPIEIQKVGNERGKFLVPSLYGQPESMGIHYKAPAKADPVPVRAVD